MSTTVKINPRQVVPYQDRRALRPPAHGSADPGRPDTRPQYPPSTPATVGRFGRGRPSSRRREYAPPSRPNHAAAH